LQCNTPKFCFNSTNQYPPSFFNKAFSLDADGTTFNDAEKDAIIKIWAGVSEDYSIFDVDVTTGACMV
jgi:hypothetical protein